MLAKYSFHRTVTRRRSPLEQAFRSFIADFEIDSKEGGGGTRLANLYRSQELAIEQIFEGVAEGKHAFTFLKARQLGISTIMLALDLFWLSLFPGTQGALVIDDESNRDQFKTTLTAYLAKTPRRFRVRVRSHNRNQLTLANGSILYYVIAGTKKKGSYGHGKGLNYVHATELSRYGDAEAWASFVSAFAEENPRRLFVYESTARGYNLFSQVWEGALEAADEVAVFLGWWTKEAYRLDAASALYRQVMDSDITADEREKIDAVRALYGVEVSLEQLAWYRAKTRKLLSNEDEGYVEQEFPWTADEAFRLTGKVFFPIKRVNDLLRLAGQRQFMGFRFHCGDSYETVEIEQVAKVADAELRVWERPSSFGTYALGADPAYGTSIEDNSWLDRFAITVLRCYADRVVQVAEYAADDVDPHKFAWIIAFLCGWYRKTRLVLELNGPGATVFTELKHLRRELQSGHKAQRARELGIHNALQYMVHYLFQRPDSLGGNFLLQFKSNSDSKATILRRVKDAMLIKDALDVRSVPLLKEMPRIVTSGGFIGAEGRAKDDRTLALALAYRGYDDWIRAEMSNNNQTYAAVTAREKAAATDRRLSFQGHIVANHFQQAQLARLAANRLPGEWKFNLRDRIPLPGEA